MLGEDTEDTNVGCARQIGGIALVGGIDMIAATMPSGPA